MNNVFNTTFKTSAGSCQLPISSEKNVLHYFRNYTTLQSFKSLKLRIAS